MNCTKLVLLMKVALHALCFSLLGMSLGSCKNADQDLTDDGVTPVKSEANNAYRAPSTRGPVPRNPDMKLSSSFDKDAGVTFSRVT